MAANAWSRSECPQRGASAIADMEASGCEPDTFSLNTAINSCAKSGDFAGSLSIFDRMTANGTPPDGASFNMAFNACSKTGQWQRCLSLLDEMRRAGLAPNATNYSAAIALCGNGGQWERAVSLLEEMRGAGVAPNVLNYNGAISACAKSGEWARALTLLDAMRSEGIAPSAITFNMAINACSKSGNWQRCLSLLDESIEAGLAADVVAFTATISACYKRQPERALSLFGRMRVSGVQPDAVCYSLAVAACAASERWPRALELLDEMNEAEPCVRPCTVVCLNTLMIACEKGGQPARALALFDEMREAADPAVPLNEVSYNLAIRACEQVEPTQWQRALSLLGEMKRAGDGTGSGAAADVAIRPTIASYTGTMQALVAACELDAAFTLLAELQATPLMPDSFGAHHVLLTACRRTGHDGRAEEVQADIHRLGLSSLAAVVCFVIDGEERSLANGAESEEAEEAEPAACTDALFSRVCSETRYVPVCAALPLAFVQRASEADQVRSLKHHAEKKALASLLRAGSSDLAMSVNIKVCADCHSFLQHASAMLNRSIRVREPSREHVFVADAQGACTCDGRGYELLLRPPANAAELEEACEEVAALEIT